MKIEKTRLPDHVVQVISSRNVIPSGPDRSYRNIMKIKEFNFPFLFNIYDKI